MPQKTLGKEEIKISKCTLSIADEEASMPKTWEDFQKEEIVSVEDISYENVQSKEKQVLKKETLASVVPADAVLGGMEAGLKVIELIKNSSIVTADLATFKALPQDDPDSMNYLGETFRSPAKGNYRCLIWTVSLWPCGSFEFYFEVTSKGRPKNPKIPDGYYIPNITIIPHKPYAWIANSLNVKVECSNPIRSETKDGLVVANLNITVSATLSQLFGAIKWPWMQRFRVSGDKTELIRI